MKVLYKCEEIDLIDTIDNNIKYHDLFKDINENEDTIELQPEELNNKNNLSKIELEKTIELGGNINE